MSSPRKIFYDFSNKSLLLTAWEKSIVSGISGAIQALWLSTLQNVPGVEAPALGGLSPRPRMILSARAFRSQSSAAVTYHFFHTSSTIVSDDQHLDFPSMA